MSFQLLIEADQSHPRCSMEDDVIHLSMRAGRTTASNRWAFFLWRNIIWIIYCSSHDRCCLNIPLALENICSMSQSFKQLCKRMRNGSYG
jgi:hypothetical protein